MGLNVHFPQLSPGFSLWSPLQAAIPVLHWAASWCFVLPGWEPNLVSLAPLSHTVIHSQKEDPLRNLLVYGPGGQGNNMNLPIIGVLQQYLGLLVLGLGLLHLSLVLLLLRLGLLHLKLGLWRRA
ncbi:hypothetical protein DSO57_1035830 [Entomophthora muscae]|uniref:Uncharacterized protein n=1 Tax=Entomophthora muscae TaxID=34485 RepID=A0ACC2SZI8_9FUNG|nr:hypothetical protein DSO57_1035830 [Entomophthora muscae]